MIRSWSQDSTWMYVFSDLHFTVFFSVCWLCCLINIYFAQHREHTSQIMLTLFISGKMISGEALHSLAKQSNLKHSREFYCLELNAHTLLCSNSFMCCDTTHKHFVHFFLCDPLCTAETRNLVFIQLQRLNNYNFNLFKTSISAPNEQKQEIQIISVIKTAPRGDAVDDVSNTMLYLVSFCFLQWEVPPMDVPGVTSVSISEKTSRSQKTCSLCAKHATINPLGVIYPFVEEIIAYIQNQY